MQISFCELTRSEYETPRSLNVWLSVPGEGEGGSEGESEDGSEGEGEGEGEMGV